MDPVCMIDALNPRNFTPQELASHYVDEKVRVYNTNSRSSHWVQHMIVNQMKVSPPSLHV